MLNERIGERVLTRSYVVCVLQDHTLVGSPNAPVEQDIQLSGLGIMPEHCIVDIVDGDVFMTPLEGARYDTIRYYQ